MTKIIQIAKETTDDIPVRKSGKFKNLVSDIAILAMLGIAWFYQDPLEELQ